ncbi:hypothetical protein AB835_01635 [Candidatus Endobugula sertula]|uniref:Glycosyltransferase 2-like domain-containing protein n=1 Tax=Candidatus Endobugula sertula TaxID=62101 RepID=A0A1D2QTA2_9GAMM|nr:hypothetical protein AB835_01635 [Candidatus Endobugula sertula]
MFYIIAFIYSLLVLPPTLYLLLISLAGIKQPKRHAPAIPISGTIGILIPAHNEALNIQRTIESISQAAQKNGAVEINVIADNCSDNTAELARATGVNVLERHNKTIRGKGAALQWAMAELANQNYDFTMIIDADSIVNEAFFHELRCKLNEPGCEVVQTRYEAMVNEHSSIKRLAMLGFNILRARGRMALGGSAGIMGNGFVLSKATLEKVPFQSNSIVEDLEYHMRLVEANIRVTFCNEARIYGEMPTSHAASDIQSSRWEGGRIRVLKAMWWPLLKQFCLGLTKGQWHALEALLDLMLLPIGYMVMVLFAALLFPYTRGIGLFGFMVIGIYILGAAYCGRGISELVVLKRVPEFLFRKLCRLPHLFHSCSGKAAWQRTPRDQKK